MSVDVWSTILVAVILVVIDVVVLRIYKDELHDAVTLVAAQGTIAAVACAIGGIWWNDWNLALFACLAMLVTTVIGGLIFTALLTVIPNVEEEDVAPLEVLSRQPPIS